MLNSGCYLTASCMHASSAAVFRLPTAMLLGLRLPESVKLFSSAGLLLLLNSSCLVLLARASGECLNMSRPDLEILAMPFCKLHDKPRLLKP